MLFIKKYTEKIFLSSLYLKLVTFIFLFFFSKNLFADKLLKIKNQKNDVIYLEMSVKTGDRLTYKWIHSFEHIPWFEEYEILEDNTLLLHNIKVAGFGAGIPENIGKVSVGKDGFVKMEKIEKIFEKIMWINSNTALSYIAVNNKIIIKGINLPHHVPLKLEIIN